MSNQPDGLTIARQRIAHEAEAQTGFLDLGMLGLTELPEEIFRLKHLRRLNLGNFDDTFGRSLAYPLTAQISIKHYLECLVEFPDIIRLYLIKFELKDLDRIAILQNLHELYCSETQVSDLRPLAAIANLQVLDCSSTQVSDLGPLAGLANLQSLLCYGTEVSDLGPLAGLANLQSLLCYGTKVSDLGPLAGVSNLQTLDCSITPVSDLGPLAGLANLKKLGCSYTSLAVLPRSLLDKPSLQELVLFDCRLPGVPSEVLSQSWTENCLESLRAHVRDLAAGTVDVPDVKLMVLGNGRVGKTQLCRRLRGEGYDDAEPSTHGILVTGAPLPADNGADTRLNIWDFGGQDIYHGTHALFMRSRAIFVLAWTPDLEDSREHEHGGMVFRNHPLAYWVDYVRHLAGPDSPVLVVQTRCDRPEDDAPCPVPEAALFEAFRFVKVLRHSARTDRGRAALTEALADGGLAEGAGGDCHDRCRAVPGEVPAGGDARRRCEAAAAGPAAPHDHAGALPQDLRRRGRGQRARAPAVLPAQCRDRVPPAGAVQRRHHPGPGLGAGGDLCRVPS